MAEPGTRTARWVLAALLAIGTVVWALSREDQHRPTADPHADAPYYYVYLPSLVLDHDLQFANEYRETKNWYRLGNTPTGRPGNVFGIGPAIYGLPAFVLGHAIAKATDERTDGFSRWETWSYTFASLPWSLAAVWLAFRLCRRRFGGGARALVGPVIAACAGPVVYYAVRQPGYAHPVATFFATWFIERWDASYEQPGPRSLRTWLVLGATLGAAALARPQLALWGVLLARAALDDLDARDALPGWRWKLPLRWLGAGAIAALVFAPQLIAWKVLYGHYYVVPQGPGFMRWDDPCWSETLFSSRNGLFAWSPAYALFGVALVVALRRMPRLAGALIAGVLLQAIANGAVWDWWAGGSFGGRRFDSAYLAFAVGAQLLVALILAALARARAGLRERAIVPLVRGGAAVAAIAILGALVIANLQLAAATSVTSARIKGGEPAAPILRRTGKGPIGTIAGWASSLATWPARAAFAWAHDAPLDAYDRVVGAHVLGDTYPGLNSYKDERTAELDFRDVGRPIYAGLAPGPRPNTAVMTGERARILVVLNRGGRLDLRLALEGAGQVAVSWNGRERLATAFATGAVFTIRVDDLRRGANDLVIEAPAGTVLRPIGLEGSDIPQPPRI